jgi:superfamily II DNA or RNA helicase
MTAPRELRPYQTEAVDAVFGQWATEVRRTAVVLPTGTGKSTVIGKIAAVCAGMDLRVAMLAHRAELLDQMAGTVAEVDPDAPPVGIVRGEIDDPRAQIVAASFQTLVNDHRHAALGRRDVVLVDETHHVTADSYRRVVEDFGPEAFMCGFTATLRRQDGKPLRELIQSIAYERNLRWAIEQDFLVKPRGITVKIPDLDLGKVKTTAGDFQNRDLAEVMEAETPEIVKAILRHCGGRRPIVFAASVQAAHDIAEMLNVHLFTAEAVTGEMPYGQRQNVYERYRTGRTRALVTVMVLTEGADFPMCDAVVIARPTQSQNLYSQMVGRALRLWPDKDDALVVDLVGTSRVLKLVTVSSLDAGVVPKVVDPDGVELPPEDDDEIQPLAGITAKARRMGPIETIGIDLLGPDETNVLWLTTVKGVPFVQPRESDFFWFLWDHPHWSSDTETLYRVGKMPLRGQGSGGWRSDPLPLSSAVALVEDEVIEEGLSLPTRTASWRRYQPGSEAQLRYARTLGIINPEDMTRARISDEISIALVSRKLDGSR